MKNDDLSDDPPEFASPLLTYSSDRVHSGSLTVNEPGRYILCWDNSRSWLREKTISYKVNVRKLERSVEEISSFSKKVYDTLCQKEEQLMRVTDSIEAQVSEKEALKKRLTLLLQQMKVEKEEINSQEELIMKKKEEMEAIKSQREVLQQHASYLKLVAAPFLVEGERIFSMLCGVDLLRMYFLFSVFILGRV
ncbi:uncharacterized protein [Blastocystis hominis]|uniref:GOLD domain-containing protein n=1 Tax=Blastocystis hominis TaxID=12968 RepID=D8LVJ4_BLAHO|nr:uncharacterized protein [Blastocystis hominis]CBK19833.2 unnamed protein product [Blastocystis hominis]|eukprot:XP_012893881.1 uncharacterized protein [Blastocystis hominis]